MYKEHYINMLYYIIFMCKITLLVCGKVNVYVWMKLKFQKVQFSELNLHVGVMQGYKMVTAIIHV